MKRMIAVVSLSLLPLIVSAESSDVPPLAMTSTENSSISTIAAPSVPMVAPTASIEEEETSSSTWRTVVTGLGVMGGVIVADLFMGGSLTSSLFSWGSSAAVATGPVIYSPEVLSAHRAGAVLGEMITPATSIRDAAAIQDMFYTLVLGVGGALGAMVTYGLTVDGAAATAK